VGAGEVVGGGERVARVVVGLLLGHRRPAVRAAGSDTPEGARLTNAVIDLVGEDVLMYASDYPHSECQFPNSVDNILQWTSLGPETKRKLLWDNAVRFYKRT